MPLLLLACAGTDTADIKTGADTGLPDDTDDTDDPPDVYVPALSSHRRSLEEWEPALAVSPDGAHLASSWTEYPPHGSFPLGFSVSDDGGATWSAPVDVPSPDGAAADSVVDWVGDRFVLAWLDHDGAADHIYAATTTDGSFGDPVEVSDPSLGDGFDKPWLTTLADGSALLTWQGVGRRNVTGFAARSGDGNTWTSAEIASDGVFRNLYYPCVSDSGRVWVTYYVEGSYAVRWSDDDGATWSGDDTIVATGVPFAEPECVAAGDTVWVVYGTSTDPDGEETGTNPRLDAVYLASSHDGETFDPVALPIGNHSHALAPQIARTAAGDVVVDLYAGDDEGDADGALVVIDAPGGDASAATVAEWTSPVPFAGDRSSDVWIGDYVGFRSLADGTLACAYTEAGGDGYGHIAFRRGRVP